jgi:hypothetical protein
MNYSKIYDSLVAKAQSRPIPDCYTERHHVVPRCLGGSDEATNLVVLTAREHCFAHLLLARIHGGKLWHAANLMANVHNMKSRAYAIAKGKFVENFSGENHPMFGKKHSTESLTKMSGENHPYFGKKLSFEHRMKIAESKFGKKPSRIKP